MNKNGFIFDLDGVIVDTAKYHFKAWKSLADELGIHFDETLNEELKGVSRVDSLHKILNWGGLTISEDEFNAFLVSKNEDYLAYIDKMDADEILPDVCRVLDYLKSKGCAIALGSASKNAVKILTKVGLLHYFDAIVDGNSVSNAKPNPEVFLKAADLLGVIPKECVVFEDAIAGIEAANNAEMYAVGIGNSKTLKNAQIVFDDFTSLSDAFLNQLIN